MKSFREFFVETPKGEKQSRDASIFWKDARAGAKPNITYASNKLNTNEEEKILNDLRDKGGQVIATPKMLHHLRNKGIGVPRVGDNVFVGRSGKSTFHVALYAAPDGKFILKGVA